MGATPEHETDVLECISSNPSNLSRCAPERSDALRANSQSDESEAVSAAGVVHIPVWDLFCGTQSCPIILGQYLIYRDDHHITSAFSRFLAPAFEDRLLNEGINIGD